MFITADIGRLDLLSSQFAEFDQFRANIEPILIKLRAAQHLGVSVFLELHVVPQNQFQVNVLRLAASKVPGDAAMLAQIDAECVHANMKAHEIPIVAWDARTTWFDILPKSPMDTRKGVVNYKVYDWQPGDVNLHKDLQDQVVHKVRSILLQ